MPIISPWKIISTCYNLLLDNQYINRVYYNQVCNKRNIASGEYGLVDSVSIVRLLLSGYETHNTRDLGSSPRMSYDSIIDSFPMHVYILFGYQ